MIKIKVGYTENGKGDEIFMINNDAPTEFLCEHCGELRRKVFYSQSGGIKWCKMCFTALNVVKFKTL